MDVATGGTKRRKYQPHEPSDETWWTDIKTWPVKRIEQPESLIEKS